jgi:hypothetical protein
MLMRLTLMLAVVMFGSGFHGARAEDPDLRPRIRASVAAILKDVSKYQQETQAVDGLSLEGSEATYFSQGGSLKKINAKIYGETFNASTELYYEGGALLFVFQKLNRYDTQVGAQPPPKVVSSEEKRLYFSGGALAALRIGQKDIASSDVLWREAEEEITELASQLEARFREQKVP